MNGDRGLPGLRATRDHIPELDGLRGIAVLLVLWHHVDSPTILPELPGWFGGLGVHLFFVLSGFLITRILLYNRHRGIPIRNFIIRRGARIFPLFYLAMILLTLAGHEMHPLVWVYAHNITMWDGMGVAAGFMGHCWSLCLEEQFYLVWPFALLLPLRWVKRGAAWAIVGIVALSLGLEVWAGPMISRPLYFAPPFGAMCLLAGALLAFHEHAVRGKWRVCVIGFALLVFGLLISPVSPMVYQYAGSRTTIAGMFTATGAMMVVLSGALPAVRWLLTMRWLTATGIISYGLYIWHFGIYHTVGLLGKNDGGNDMLAFGLGVTLAVSIASYHLYEKPVRNLINRWAAHDKTPASAETLTGAEERAGGVVATG